jgi:lipoprotein NlpI
VNRIRIHSPCVRILIPSDSRDWCGTGWEADLLASVAAGAGAGADEYACVALFYIGITHLLAGEQTVAADHFKARIATGCRKIGEHRSAKAELARLAPTAR